METRIKPPESSDITAPGCSPTVAASVRQFCRLTQIQMRRQCLSATRQPTPAQQSQSKL